MSTIVLTGKNGAGKDTRLDKFMKGREDRFQVLAMSNLLRKVRETDPELWERIDAIMKAGDLVPDDIILSIVAKELESATKTVICNGFPRTAAQAAAMVAMGHVPDAVVELHVDDEVVVQRAKDRIICSKCKKPYTLNDFNPPKVEGVCDDCGAPLVKRDDDEESIVRKRLAQYNEQTPPILKTLIEAGAEFHKIDNNAHSAEDSFKNVMCMY
ncbi:MAG: nucleoside monophosphate kinase [Clostridia bacterium]|nr:nucleoside monophosphate kinase [Clostridia bacterium]MBQ7882505.1 nucleoside monophosphate kinase [Treponema sp.]